LRVFPSPQWAHARVLVSSECLPELMSDIITVIVLTLGKGLFSGPDMQQPPRRYELRWITEQEATTAKHRLCIEQALQQLNIEYPLSEHSRALYRVGPEFEDPLDDDMPLMMNRLELAPFKSSIVMMERTQRWGKLLMPPQIIRARPMEFFFHPFYLCFIVLALSAID
ncbi:hypothetical protein HAX54_035717, partial [Datura stramonium]|nr:hypothetical protein [Datura stramonium]